MEARVLIRVGLARCDLALLRAEQLAQLGELRLRETSGRQGGDGRLDDAAEFDDVLQGVAASDERLQRPSKIVGRDLTDERSATRARLDDAQELERAQRLSDRRARDLELISERPLRGELVAWMQLALLQERFDLLDDALVEPAAPDRLDGRQVDLPKVLWSGGLTSCAKTLKRPRIGVKRPDGRPEVSSGLFRPGRP
jgi:hypothetical protein